MRYGRIIEPKRFNYTNYPVTDCEEKTMNICRCGSKLESWDVKDARGIFVARVCEKCKKEKLKAYRPEIFSNANYETEEPIDED